MILVYNPTCELAVQHDTVNYQPAKHLMDFERRYGALMMFLAGEGDAVVADCPGRQELDFWKERGVAIPEFIDRAEARRRIANGEHLKPWGMSREVLYRFGGHALSDGYNDQHRRLFSRLTSVAVDDALASAELPDFFREEVRPRIVDDVDMLPELVGDGMCVLKTLWSASGRGVSLVSRPEFVKPAIVRFSANVRNDGAVVWEPLLDRVVDFAMLFEVCPNGNVIYLGKNYYRSDEAGRFGVELIGCDPIHQYVEAGLVPADWEQIASEKLRCAISQSVSPSLYVGPVGVDSMLYRRKSGEMAIRLCIEANVRHSMGNVNMRIAKCFEGESLEWTLGDESLIKILKR